MLAGTTGGVRVRPITILKAPRELGGATGGGEGTLTRNPTSNTMAPEGSRKKRAKEHDPSLDPMLIDAASAAVVLGAVTDGRYKSKTIFQHKNPLSTP